MVKANRHIRLPNERLIEIWHHGAGVIPRSNLGGFDAQMDCRRRIVSNGGNSCSRRGTDHNRPDYWRGGPELLHFRRQRIFCRLYYLQLDGRSGPNIDVPCKGHKSDTGDDPCELRGSDLDERRG